MRIKIEIQNKFYIWLKGEIEKNNNFSKKTKKKNRNQTMRIKLKNIIP